MLPKGAPELPEVELPTAQFPPKPPGGGALPAVPPDATATNWATWRKSPFVAQPTPVRKTSMYVLANQVGYLEALKQQINS